MIDYRTVPDPLRFRVAFSFAGAQRDRVAAIATEIEHALGRGTVFYDDWFEYYIAGDDGDLRLGNIYSGAADLVIVCVSAQYNDRQWTRLEHRYIRALSFAGTDLRALPLRLDDGDVEGLTLANTIITDVRDREVGEIVSLILSRLELVERAWRPRLSAGVADEPPKPIAPVRRPRAQSRRTLLGILQVFLEEPAGLPGHSQSRWDLLCVDPDCQSLLASDSFCGHQDSWTVDAVLRVLCEAPVDNLLQDLNSACPRRREGLLFEALRYMLLVAAERLFRESHAEVAGQRPAARRLTDDAIPVSDPLLAAILAATELSFGLRFETGQPTPVNVLESRLPQPEPGNPGESGAALVREEYVAAAHRVTYGSDFDASGLRAASSRRVAARLRQLEQDRGYPLVLSLRATGGLADPDARRRLREELDVLGIPAYFRVEQDVPTDPLIAQAIADLKLELLTYFYSTNAEKAEEPTMTAPPKDAPAGGGVVNNFTFHGHVQSPVIASGMTASAVGRDLHQGTSGQDLASLLNAIGQGIQAHADVNVTQIARDDLDTVREIFNKPAHERSDKDARMTKRCLEALETSASAIENGGKVVEAVRTAGAFLMASWPAFATLMY